MEGHRDKEARFIPGPMTRRVPLDIGCVFEATRPVDEVLRRRVIGQDEAVERLVCAFSRLLSALRDERRPLLTLLLLGPSGVGKTETARALAEALFGSERALLRIDCQEYSHGHELSKLMGSPPGYVGYQIEPLLSQTRLDAAHAEARKQHEEKGVVDELLADRIPLAKPGGRASVVLFDEVEKAHPTLWNALLGILEEGSMTLGDNTRIDFTGSLVILTSNVGAREIGEIVQGRKAGFAAGDKAATGNFRAVALEAARKEFPPELLNRFDETLVYSPLERAELEMIFDLQLNAIVERAMTRAGVPLLLQVQPEARDWILDRGMDPRFGARPLRRAMERELVAPLSRFLVADKLQPGDVVEVELVADALAFYRRGRGDRAIVIPETAQVVLEA